MNDFVVVAVYDPRHRDVLNKILYGTHNVTFHYNTKTCGEPQVIITRPLPMNVAHDVVADIRELGVLAVCYREELFGTKPTMEDDTAYGTVHFHRGSQSYYTLLGIFGANMLFLNDSKTTFAVVDTPSYQLQFTPVEKRPDQPS